MPQRFGSLTTVSTSFTRPANTTAYAAGDVVGPATLTITDATNAAPIVVTITAHGLATSDRVTIASVGGNTAANGDWVITKIDANTFSLNGSTGNGAYTSGGTLIRLLRLANVGYLKQGGGLAAGKILRTRLIGNTATITNGTFRVYYFSAQIPAIADNAAWTLLYSQRASVVGYTANMVLITEGAGSDSGHVQDTTSIPFVCGAGLQELYAVVLAEAAYVPTSGETFYIETTIDQY